MKENNIQPLWQNFLIAALLICVLVPLVFSFRAMKIPYWPILVFTFYYTVVLHFDSSKFYYAAVGGLLGILVSFSGALFGHFLGKAAGELFFVICLLFFLALLLNGRFPYVNNAGNLFLVCLSAIEPSLSAVENFFPVMASYFLGIVIFFLIKITRKHR